MKWISEKRKQLCQGDPAIVSHLTSLLSFLVSGEQRQTRRGREGELFKTLPISHPLRFKKIQDLISKKIIGNEHFFAKLFFLLHLGGQDWKLLAEKLGLRADEIRFLDFRVKDPCEGALNRVASQGSLNVGDLYNYLVELGYPLIADEL